MTTEYPAEERRKRLDEIRQSIIAELRCPLKDTATNLVFGKGNPGAEILFIGEAPGEKEDLLGMPFVGAAGKQLDALLRSIGLGIDDVYIANILKYRPPNNRNPTMDEIRNHTPYLVRQILAIRPKVICTLGNFSTKFVLASFDVDKMKTVKGISELHGKPIRTIAGDMEFTVFPLYHPAAMLYKPGLRADLETDIRAVGAFLGRTPVAETGSAQTQTREQPEVQPQKQAQSPMKPSKAQQGLLKWT